MARQGRRRRNEERRFNEEQIIGILKEAGAQTGELCRRHGIIKANFYRWKAKCTLLDFALYHFDFFQLTQ
jgi:transposase-like protein